MFKMKTVIAGAFAGAFALLLSVAPSFSTPLNEVAASTYQVAQGGRSHCSGVAISEKYIATAAHCVPSGKRVLSVVMPDGYGEKETFRIAYRVDVKRINYETDVAILELRGDLTFPYHVEIAPTFTPVWGDEVFAVGYPRVEELTFTAGMFTAYSWVDQIAPLNGEFVKATTPVTGGSSGGGFYTREWNTEVGDWDYLLVGLTTATYRDVSFQSYFSTLANLKALTKALLDG